MQGKVISEYSQKSCAYHCVVPCVLLSVGASLNRQVLRQKLGMERAFLRDCVLHTFCNICAVNQEFLESHKHRSQGNFTLLPIGFKNNGLKGKSSFTPDAPIDYE